MFFIDTQSWKVVANALVDTRPRDAACNDAVIGAP
jgi:hypothetical protein